MMCWSESVRHGFVCLPHLAPTSLSTLFFSMELLASSGASRRGAKVGQVTKWPLIGTACWLPPSLPLSLYFSPGVGLHSIQSDESPPS